VAAGLTSANFTVTTNVIADNISVTVSADYGGTTRTATLTVSGLQQGGGITYYVSPSGSDSNPGSQAQPFRTIQRAANIVNPGDTVIVEDGVYTRTASPCAGVVCISRSGLATNWIIFKSRNKWGAKLDGQNSTTAEGFTFTNNAGYVRVEGFEIYGMGNMSASASGIDMYAGGHDSQIVGNRIHHIGNNCAPHSNGQVGIFIQVPNVMAEGNLIHDIGRYFPGEGGCSYSSGFRGYQSLDHGMYINGSSSGPAGRASDVVIRNNIFYNTKHGWGVQLYPGTIRNIGIYNNTFAFGNPNKNYTFIVMNASLTNVEVRNNIFYQPEGGKTIELGTSLSASNVVIANNVSSGNAMTDRTPISGMTLSSNRTSLDAMLANPAGFDFRLRAGSPAIDTGISLLQVVNDFDGRARPQGGAYDVGAYETSPTTSLLPLSPTEVAWRAITGLETQSRLAVSQYYGEDRIKAFAHYSRYEVGRGFELPMNRMRIIRLR
jgi:hypothetical protein